MADSSSLVDLLRQRACQQSNSLAYTLLIDGEQEGATFNYLEVDLQARAIGAVLQSLGAKHKRILLVYPPGIDFVFAFYGCLYADAVAVPTQAPASRLKNNQSLTRFQAILNDASPLAVLTTSVMLPKLKSLVESVVRQTDLYWIATDELSAGIAEQWQNPVIEAESLALLQYTSGSTASPKGVMVSHRNLLTNSNYIDYGFEHTPQSLSLSWLPHSHDMGLINGIIQPLYKGFRCLMMSPAAFIQSPYRWLKAISQYRISHTGGPNFAYELCLRKITSEQRSTLDLSCWAVAFNGAEPVRKQTLEEFAKAFAPCGFQFNAFYPAYGLAEATLKVTGGRKKRAPVFITLDAVALEKNLVVEASATTTKERSLVGAGSADCETKVVVVNPYLEIRCSPSKIGEIWVSGPGIAQGYLNREEESKRIFRAFLKDTGEGPFLRTGDLGFQKDGELFITGRIKDLIIIRGVNHYPQDIELSVERCHTALRPGGGAAFPVEVEGSEQLVVAHEIDFRQSPDVDEVINSIRRAVAEEHEVQAHAIALLNTGALPKTTSGKVQRSLCRSLFLEGSLDSVYVWQSPAVENLEAPFAETISLKDEEAITKWLRSLLSSRIGVGASAIDVARPITHYGLDSLLAIELMHQIQSAFNVVLAPSDFLESPSISQLAIRIKEQLDSEVARPVISTGIQHGDFPLSAGQQSLWFLHQIAPGSAAYNIPVAVKIVSEIDIAALRNAFQLLADRQAMLRTTFSDFQGEPFQQVHRSLPVHFEVQDVSQWQEQYLKERLSEAANEAFDLEKGPLFRVMLFSKSPQEHILLLVIHHIVADLWSLAVLLQELGSLYSSRKDEQNTFKPLEYQYTDYVRWESERLAGPEGDRLSSYWQKQLSGAATATNLPLDKPRPKFQTFRGASIVFRINSNLTDKLKQIGREQDVTLYMTLLAAFQVLLHRYTGQTDFLIGSPASGRTRMETAKIVGYFVNPLVMRANVSGSESFNNVVSRVRQTVIEALDHDGYPFPLLVKQLQPERDTSRSPVFQVLFVMQKTHMLGEEGLALLLMGVDGSRMNLGELTLEPVLLEKEVTQFDLSLSVTETGGELFGSLEYNTDLFDRSTIERMAEHFQIIIRSLLANPDQPISGAEILTEVERQLLSDWANTSIDYGQSEILSELFQNQVDRTPQEIALSFEDRELTYDELNRRANKLAHRLKREGVGPDVLVGLLMERSIEMVVGLLGILKAGGAYVPFDPHYPQERLSFMLQDAQPKIILTQQHFVGRVDFNETKAICLDTGWLPLENESDHNPETSARAESLAYVIYTSGSTGKPKGAMNTHQAITNRLCWMQEAYGLDGSDKVLQKTPYTFDVSVWEFFWPLITGARLVLSRPGGHQDSNYLINLISQQRITTLHFVPSMLHAFLDNPRVESCSSLRRVICSGEALSIDLQRRFFARLNTELHNLYGPTEAAVDVTFWACQKESTRTRVPIGHPIANIQIHILDSHLQAVPIGVSGELYIAGKGLARGYLNRPDLTDEKFILNPFSSEPGARIYKTGDLARRLADGEIEFLGRIDHQVKVRGFRIELGEIETALAAHTAVSEVVVTAREYGPGDTRLTAYIVPTVEARASLQSVDQSQASIMKPDVTQQHTIRHKLPNGLLIAHDGEIQFNTMDIYREVFEKEVYLKHGITLNDGDCVFDVGAHIGLFTLFVSRKCRNARIYAFEPIPPTFDVLRANASIPGHKITLLNFGLADREKVDSFHYYPRMTGVSGRIANPEDHKKNRKPILLNWFQSITGGQPTSMLSDRDISDILEEYFKSEIYECRLRTLSDVIRENGIERIDLLKIDVEESERDVLAGIRKEDWAKINQIVIEVESKSNLEFVISLLKENEYEVFVDSIGYAVASDCKNDNDLAEGDIAAYMIYGLLRKTSEVRPFKSSFNILQSPKDSELNSDSLRNYLMEKLPDYMVPSAFVLIDAMPLLSNGKVDLNSLPAPGYSRQQLDQEYIAPRNEVELTLARIFAEVLGVEKVGVEDNFFKLGGHSLLATQAMSRILARFKVELPLQHLFEHPTVAGFSKVITSVSGFRQEEIDPIIRVNTSVEERLLAKLDELSNEEIEALLRDDFAENRREE